MNVPNAQDRLIDAPIDRIKVEYNPRRSASKEELQALAESMRGGLAQRPRLRTIAGGFYGIVIGHRRFEAAKILGWASLPAVLSECDDAEALALKAIENSQREDVHPLEEAECYGRMHQPPKGAAYAGKTTAEIAAKVGRSPSYVAQRLALLKLDPGIRKLYADDELSLAAVLNIARLPPPSQEALVKDLRNDYLRYDDRLAQHITKTYLLRLKQAPFDAADATLVKSAGACGPCPRRAANAQELFPDVAKDDLCTDAACYQTKADAAWARQTEEKRKRGWKIVKPEESEQWFDAWDPAKLKSYGCPVALLNAKHPTDKQGRTWRQLLSSSAKKNGEAPPLVAMVARDRTGAAREVIDVKEATRLIAKLGHKLPKKAASSSDYKPSKAEVERREKSERANAAAAATRAALIAAIVEKSTREKRGGSFSMDGFVDWLLDWLLGDDFYSDAPIETAERRGWMPAEEEEKAKRHQAQPPEICRAQAAKLDANGRFGLLVELVLREQIEHYNGDKTLRETTAKRFGINVDAVVKAAKAAHAAKLKAEAAEAKAAAPAKKGARR